MSPLKQTVKALGCEINRLWAIRNPLGSPPLVPLPRQDGGNNGGDSLREKIRRSEISAGQTEATDGG